MREYRGDSMFDLGYFVYMDSYEKDDNKNRTTKQNDFERENEAHYKENIDEKYNYPISTAPPNEI